jgi:hypothetical protein
MICRIWHGWMLPANADAYETLVLNKVFQRIESRAIAGYRGIQRLYATSGRYVSARHPRGVGAHRAAALRAQCRVDRQGIPT